MKLAVALLLGALVVFGALGVGAKTRIFQVRPAEISKSEKVHPNAEAAQPPLETPDQQFQNKRTAFAHKLEDNLRKTHPDVRVIATGEGSATLRITSPATHQAINAVLPRDPEMLKEALGLGFTRIEALSDGEASWTISSDLN